MTNRSSLTEFLIHFTVRQFLRNHDWVLVAGQYPGGSDDELLALSIRDPRLAKDSSPDPRRHDTNKLVPDLVAQRDRFMLLVEMKPNYSSADERKLEIILDTRKSDLVAAVNQLFSRRPSMYTYPPEELTYLPALGFGSGSSYPANPNFCYFLVSPGGKCKFIGNNLLPDGAP